MNSGTDGQWNEQTGERTDRRMDGQWNGRTGERTDSGTNKQENGRTVERMDSGMDGQENGHVENIMPPANLDWQRYNPIQSNPRLFQTTRSITHTTATVIKARKNGRTF